MLTLFHRSWRRLSQTPWRLLLVCIMTAAILGVAQWLAVQVQEAQRSFLSSRQWEGFEVLLVTRRTPSKIDLLFESPPILPRAIVRYAHDIRRPAVLMLPTTWIGTDRLLTRAVRVSVGVALGEQLASDECWILGLPTADDEAFKLEVRLNELFLCKRREFPQSWEILGQVLPRIPLVLLGAQSAKTWLPIDWESTVRSAYLASLPSTNSILVGDDFALLESCCNLKRLALSGSDESRRVQEAREFVLLSLAIVACVSTMSLIYGQRDSLILEFALKRVAGQSPRSLFIFISASGAISAVLSWAIACLFCFSILLALGAEADQLMRLALMASSLLILMVSSSLICSWIIGLKAYSNNLLVLTRDRL